jgi:hypothetical protein
MQAAQLPQRTCPLWCGRWPRRSCRRHAAQVSDLPARVADQAQRICWGCTAPPHSDALLGPLSFSVRMTAHCWLDSAGGTSTSAGCALGGQQDARGGDGFRVSVFCGAACARRLWHARSHVEVLGGMLKRWRLAAGGVPRGGGGCAGGLQRPQHRAGAQQQPSLRLRMHPVMHGNQWHFCSRQLHNGRRRRSCERRSAAAVRGSWSAQWPRSGAAAGKAPPGLLTRCSRVTVLLAAAGRTLRRCSPCCCGCRCPPCGYPAPAFSVYAQTGTPVPDARTSALRQTQGVC